MFRKTLASLAVLATCTGAAAGEIIMYGRVDTGLEYIHTDAGNGESTSSFGLASGTNTASRFGLKGEEDLGNGLKAGFVLENGFTSDDGAFKTSGRIFDREALLWVSGDFGEVGAGRLGELASGNGRYSLFGSQVNPMSTSWGALVGYRGVMAGGFGRMDNTVVYKTPKFAGVNVLAQYSFKKDNASKAYGSGASAVNADWADQREGSSAVDRHYALGVSYQSSDLYLTGVVTQTNLASTGNGADPDAEDPFTVCLGGNYVVDGVRLYLAAEYFKESKPGMTQLQEAQESTRLDGYGLTLGAYMPVMGGKFRGFVGYMDAEDQAHSGAEARDFNRYVVTVGYEYPFSKRTYVYAGAGYYMDRYDYKVENCDDKATQIVGALGLAHKF